MVLPELQSQGSSPTSPQDGYTGAGGAGSLHTCSVFHLVLDDAINRKSQGLWSTGPAPRWLMNNKDESQESARMRHLS